MGRNINICRVLIVSFAHCLLKKEINIERAPLVSASSCPFRTCCISRVDATCLRQHELRLLINGIRQVHTLGSVTLGMITECKALGAGFGGFV